MNEHLHPNERGIRSPGENKIFPPTVIKIGGSTVGEREKILGEIADLYPLVKQLWVVHGGGKEIDLLLEKLGLFSGRINGERITTAQILNLAVVPLLDGIGAQIVGHFRKLGVPAKGYNSKSGLLKGTIENPDLGFVGKVTRVDTYMLNKALAERRVPVITPIAVAENSSQIFKQLLNINADNVAGKVASSIRSNLILLTDVAGVLDKDKNLIPELSETDSERLQQEGVLVIDRGMKPKLDASFDAVKSGTVFICHSSELKKVFFGKPKGTHIKV